MNTANEPESGLPEMETSGETRVLVTGANGFVGRHLIAHLLGQTGSAIGAKLPSLSPGIAPEQVKIIAAVHPDHVAQLQQEPSHSFNEAGWVGGSANGQIEIRGVEFGVASSVEDLIAGTRPQRIYHLAARSSGADVQREQVFAVNVQGVRDLLEACARLQPFPRVLLASTGYVYGNTDPNRPASESDPIGPLWRFGAYADSKIEMETVARAYRGFAIVARAFAHTGPGQMPTFAVPAFAHQIVRMEKGLDSPELRVGNLDAWRDLLDVRDVVCAYALLMQRAPLGEAFNIATGNAVQMRQVVERLCRLSDVQPQIVIDPARLRPLDIACSTGDPARLQMVTGWKPQYALDDTLRDMLKYFRSMMEL